MHVSSDMFTEQEIERVNKGENVDAFINKDCTAGYQFRDGCDVTILVSPFSSCEVFNEHTLYTARPHHGLELTEISDEANGVVAYKYRMTSYVLYYFAQSNLSAGTFSLLPNKVTHKPVTFSISCVNKKFPKLLRNKIVKSFTVTTFYCKFKFR